MGKRIICLTTALFITLLPLNALWKIERTLSAKEDKILFSLPPLNYHFLEVNTSVMLALRADEPPVITPKGEARMICNFTDSLSCALGNLRGNTYLAPLFTWGFALATPHSTGSPKLRATFCDQSDFMAGLLWERGSALLYLATLPGGGVSAFKWNDLSGALLLLVNNTKEERGLKIPYGALPLEKGAVTYLSYNRSGISLLLRLTYDYLGGFALSNVVCYDYASPFFKINFKRIELPLYLGAVGALAYKTEEGPLELCELSLTGNYRGFKLSFTGNDKLYRAPVYAQKGQRRVISLKGELSWRGEIALIGRYERRYNRSLSVSEKTQFIVNQALEFKGVDLKIEQTFTFREKCEPSGRLALNYKLTTQTNLTLNISYTMTEMKADVTVAKVGKNWRFKGQLNSVGALSLSLTIYQ
ncbi:MAG: hypothetical protein WCY78_00165 [Sphaerochaetaceae bacterium]